MSMEPKMQQSEGAVKNPSSPTAVSSEGCKIIATQVSGTVGWFNFKEGFGFIKRSDTKEDIFFHYTAVRSKNPRKYLSSAGDGATVEFDIVNGKKGPQAANVTVQDNLKTEKVVSNAHEDELIDLREEAARLKKELEDVKNHFQKELADLKEHYNKDLKDKEEEFQNKLDVQMATSRRQQEEQEAKFIKELEEQKDTFEKEKRSRTQNRWFYVFGGVCVAVGFLSAKCLEK